MKKREVESAGAPPAPVVTEDQVYEALEYVYDPELEVDIVNLGLVYDVRVQGGRVDLLLTLTTIGCPARDDIEVRARASVGMIEGVEQVEIAWTFDPPWTPDRLTDEGRDMLMAMGYL